MPTFRYLLVFLALAAGTGVAAAQSTVAPTRSDVKAEARAAVKSGTTAEGELKDNAASSPQGVSQKPRGQVKSEARVANRSSDTAKGESYRGPERAARTSAMGGKSRDEVKGEAKAAVRQSTAPNNGENSYGGPEKAASGAPRN